ncbi:MAG TPA: hypothetical protein VGN17_01195 [Bryobacteraceae bacterium]
MDHYVTVSSPKEFIAAADMIPESNAVFGPNSERWTVKDCMEHVTVVEERFLGRLSEAKLVTAILTPTTGVGGEFTLFS